MTTNNPLIQESLTRITTAIRPQKDVISKFVTEKTFLNGRRFSTKDHEYQELLMQELVNPDVQFVLYKVAQAGASEIILRILMAYGATIPGFSAALLFPTLAQTSEVMKTRLSSIINQSPTLEQLKDRRVDSASVKAMTNGSIIYGLSASGTSKSTTISRPLRTLVCDEIQYADMKVISSLAARQRHQKHKSSIYFSSPRYADSDIDAEIKKCGHIWEELLICARCNHEFVPDYYEHVRIPNFLDPVSSLSFNKVTKLDLKLDDSYLECPKCGRDIPYGYPHTQWINVAENPNLPKRGMKIGPFSLPKFVTAADLVKDMVRMDDRDEFDCQFLAKPISHSKNSIDITQVKFENHDPGIINVFGLDIGKQSCLTIGSIREGSLYIHHIEFLPVKSIRHDLPQILKHFRCVAGVIDLLPYGELTAHFVNTIPNSWASVYNNSAAAAKRLELFSLKNKEDESLGTVKVINVNMTPTFDYFADQLMNGLITYKSSPLDNQVINQLSQMSRQRDYSAGRIDDGAEITYRWRKPNNTNKIEDHIHHSSVYCALAGKLISRSRYQGSGIRVGVHSFKQKTDV